jgi:hypothetical protein
MLPSNLQGRIHHMWFENAELRIAVSLFVDNRDCSLFCVPGVSPDIYICGSKPINATWVLPEKSASRNGMIRRDRFSSSSNFIVRRSQPGDVHDPLQRQGLL